MRKGLFRNSVLECNKIRINNIKRLIPTPLRSYQIARPPLLFFLSLHSSVNLQRQSSSCHLSPLLFNANVVRLFDVIKMSLSWGGCKKTLGFGGGVMGDSILRQRVSEASSAEGVTGITLAAAVSEWCVSAECFSLLEYLKLSRAF